MIGLTMDLDREEFERWMGLIRDDIRGVQTRLDAINGRVRTNESKIAVLSDRGTRTTLGVAGGAGGAAGIVLAMAWEWVKAKL